MPELPEVETTKRGISPYLLNQNIQKVIIRQPKLRQPVTPKLNELCAGKKIIHIERRSKYLLIYLSEGFLLIHLGMSGHLRLCHQNTLLKKHDHIDLELTNHTVLRYHDPRRFGLWLYLGNHPYQHPLLAHLGPEPLSDVFNGDYLYARAKSRKQSIKAFLMNSQVVVGVGNIYAAESLFLAGIHPKLPAKAITLPTMHSLCEKIKLVLQQAILAGGTTLKDFYALDGKPGYFSTALKVYGRQGKPCLTCDTSIQSVIIAGRTSNFCPNCQPLESFF